MFMECFVAILGVAVVILWVEIYIIFRLIEKSKEEAKELERRVNNNKKDILGQR